MTSAESYTDVGIEAIDTLARAWFGSGDGRRFTEAQRSALYTFMNTIATRGAESLAREALQKVLVKRKGDRLPDAALELARRLEADGCIGDDEQGCTRDDVHIPLSAWCVNCLAGRALTDLGVTPYQLHAEATFHGGEQ